MFERRKILDRNPSIGRTTTCSLSTSEEDRVNEEIENTVLWAKDVGHDTPEELCRGTADPTACRNGVFKFCDLVSNPKECGEELGWLLKGKSTVCAENEK